MLRARPFDFSDTPEVLTKADALTHHGEYLNVLRQIKGATIIDTLDAFCPNNRCQFADENNMALYYDTRHLTYYAGGKFMLEKVLKPYLDE